MNSESILKFLQNNAANNFNVQSVLNKIPELMKYWKLSKSQIVNNVAVGGQSYDPLTAVLPLFSNIANVENVLYSFSRYEGNIMAYTSHFFNDVSNVTFSTSFVTSPFLLYADPNLVGRWLAITTSNMTGNSQGGSGITAASVKAMYTIETPMLVMMFVNNGSMTAEFFPSNSNVSTSTVNVPLNTLAYYVILCDNYNYWFGSTLTLNNPQFTWVKLLSADKLPTSGLNFHLGGYRNAVPTQSTGTIGVTVYSFTGSVPWK